MQRLGDGSWVISASDLTKLSQCPWMLARTVDEKLGKGVRVPVTTDPMLELVKRLGIEHEKRVLERLTAALPRVIEIPYDRSASGQDAASWRAIIIEAARHTVAALESSADAIFQGVFFQENLPGTALDVSFQGFADFLVSSPQGWEVWDSKLARSAKDSALIQLAAYADQLAVLAIATAPEVRLVLGDGSHSIHDVNPLLESYLEQRGALLGLLEQRASDPDPTPWGDDRYPACGGKSCPACGEQITLTDDLFLIAGIRKTQRDALRVAGYTTLAGLGGATRREVLESTPGIGGDTLAQLHSQAALQLQTRNALENTPAWEILSRGILEALPAPDAGDIFFDFEGDPTYQESSVGDRPTSGLTTQPDAVRFGIEYLFGLWGEDLGADETTPGFLGLWAETFDEEKAALLRFCALVDTRRAAHPGMHVYHYAPYERTRLAALVKRHLVAAECVDRLLNGVLVDLYPIVKKGVRIGLPSYSLKALEALYFEPGTRSGIAGGGESVAAFVDYLEALRRGERDLADSIRRSIVHYNTIDCFSTEALRNWLVQSVKD